jgi:hypothetical protein
MLVCCVEMDMGTMNKKQLRAKFARYQVWAECDIGKEYLLNLYRRHGATDPRPTFRVLVVAKDRCDNDERRVAEVLAAASSFSAVLHRTWITTVTRLKERQNDALPLGSAVWRKVVGGPDHPLFPAPDIRSWCEPRQLVRLSRGAAQSQFWSPK